MASNSDTSLATQQSIKAYVDSQVTAQDLDVAGDSGTGSVDLDSQSLTIAGTSNEIETSASGQTITIGLPNDVTIGAALTVTGASTFTGNIDANGNLDVDGQTDLDHVNISGVTTATGNIIANGNIDLAGDIDVDGHTNLDNVSIAGITTFSDDVNIIDSKKIQLGNDADLKLYHNGTSSYIDNNTSHVYIRNNVDNDDGGNIYIQAKSGEDSIVCNDDGNVQLYYDNYNALQTNANGIKVQGPTGGAAILYLNADQGSEDADKFRFKAEDDGPLKIENDTSGSWETNIEINGNGNVELYYDNVKKIETLSTGVQVTGLTSTTSLTVGPGLIQEEFDSYASALTGTYNHDVVDHGMILYAYSNASASFVLNVRGDGSTTLNSLMNIGQSSVFTAYTGSNNTSYYMTDFQIDGSSQTEEWNGGSAPTAGTGSGYDVYTFNILKTANATFKVFATFSNFA